MKKYLMTAAAALILGGLTTSCTKDTDLSGDIAAQSKDALDTYEQAFLSTFGRPVEGFDWGFGNGTKAKTRAFTRTNAGKNYPATSTGINANANEWADPDKEFGGWLVPAPLTDGQKLRVQKYFQANPDLDYKDPEYRHFFVQQVYKGATAAGTNSTEIVVASDNTQNTSDKMNLLTVGENHQHINNFNYGTCSTNYEVLDNGGHVNSGPYHKDEIMLMVNIDDTSCFGYHETGSSTHHDNKAALVSAAVIDAWAEANGNPGEAVVDSWNRSFLGFDLALKEGEQAYAKDGNNFKYAKISDIPGNAPQYVWDGTKVIPIGSSSSNQNTSGSTDITDKFTGKWNNGTLDTSNSKITYYGDQWSAVSAWLDPKQDWSTYDKLVIEFEQATSKALNLVIERDGAGNYEEEIANNTTKKEIDLSNISNLEAVKQVALQLKEAANESEKIVISKIYLVGDAPQVEYYNSEYIIVNNKEIPLLNTNMNFYIGTQLTDENLVINDGNMKITVDGKECVNLPRFKAAVDAGYLPVNDKNLRTWVKLGVSDKYFSDWIVTLTEAHRTTEPEEDTDTDYPPSYPSNNVRVIAEDLQMTDNPAYGNAKADFDFNDVVFDVISATSSEIEIKILAAGGTLPLTVGGKVEEKTTNTFGDNEYSEEVLAYEVHRLFKVSTGTMVNTNATGGVNRDPVTIKIPNPQPSLAGDLIQLANYIPIRVKKNNAWIELPVAVPVESGTATITACKLCVDGSFGWCKERKELEKDARYQYIDETRGNLGSRFRMYLEGDFEDGGWWLESTKSTKIK